MIDNKWFTQNSCIVGLRASSEIFVRIIPCYIYCQLVAIYKHFTEAVSPPTQKQYYASSRNMSGAINQIGMCVFLFLVLYQPKTQAGPWFGLLEVLGGRLKCKQGGFLICSKIYDSAMHVLSIESRIKLSIHP